MATSEQFKKELIGFIPELEKFARFLTKTGNDAEDLMHDTIEKALHKSESYTPGTNMKGWLFSIQHGLFLNMKKRARYKRNYQKYLDQGDNNEAQLPDQYDYVLFEDAKEFINRLPVDQKSALYLVCHEGRSYKEAADILECSVGTVKSRVSRARESLAYSLEFDQKEYAGKSMPEKGM